LLIIFPFSDLYVHLKEEKEWTPVKPLPGQAVVILGDELRMLTRGTATVVDRCAVDRGLQGERGEVTYRLASCAEEFAKN